MEDCAPTVAEIVDAPKSRTTVKYSAGVACCRFNQEKKRYEIVMVRKRVSHCFNAFVMGQYNKSDNMRIITLFNGMTNQEKLEIMSKKFDRLWWKVWLHKSDGPMEREDEWLEIYKKKTTANYIHSAPTKSHFNMYLRKKMKFESAFLGNGRLARLMAKSQRCTEPFWEIPKGRLKRGEKKLEGALREFEEETKISAADLHLLADIKPIVNNINHMGVSYVSTYYVANSSDGVVPYVDFNCVTQLIEIDDARWMCLEDLRVMGQESAAEIAARVFKCISSRHKRNRAEL